MKMGEDTILSPSPCNECSPDRIAGRGIYLEVVSLLVTDGPGKR